MSKNDSISMSVIRRLPRYYRFLSELNDQNIDKISSTKLAQIMNVLDFLFQLTYAVTVTLLTESAEAVVNKWRSFA